MYMWHVNPCCALTAGAANPHHCGGTGGCAGSTQWLAFNYTLGVGLTASADYPYDARDGVCHAAPAVAGITGYKRLPSNDYGALMHAVATVGPIAISVATDGLGWQFYGGGVFDGQSTFGDACGFSV